MRRTRRLLLLVLVILVVAVGFSYWASRRLQKASAPERPKSLPPQVSAAAGDWRWAYHDGDRPVVEVRARDFRQVREPSRFELDQVELRLYHKDGKVFDQVRAARADFDLERKALHSEGEVEITMGVPAEARPSGRLVVIRSSGVTFESNTGRASTDQRAVFGLDRGDGEATGVVYDPSTRELFLRSQVKLNWRGRGPKSKPMMVETDQLTYRERESKIFLAPWARLKRDTLALESAGAVVTLEEGAIRLVEAQRARGSDITPERQVEYAAADLTLHFAEHGEVEKITGQGEARLVATSTTSVTTVTTDRVDLDFDVSTGESTLAKALATGQAALESRPAPRPGVAPPETRLLRSEVIALAMRAGGREIESVETAAPGRIEFVPNRPGQRRREMEGERIGLAYGPRNHIQSLRAVSVATRTVRDAGKKPASVARTWSHDLLAQFDPATGRLKQIEQWGDFRYEEGTRKARSAKATLEAPEDRITLAEGARVWDPTGSAEAATIVLDQTTGDFVAEGEVASTRLPDRKGASSALLSSEDPMQARAEKMVSQNNRRLIQYQGQAVLWQGANRLEAEFIDIDRGGGTLAARGGVRSRFVDQPSKGPQKKAAPPVFTFIRSAEMLYTDAGRVAHYRGGAVLLRDALEVKAREIRAFLKDKDADSSLDHALADGQVEITRNAAGRRRDGASEHAEYVAAEEKIILTGQNAVFNDSQRGSTKGRKLTYYAKSDRLVVDGADRPAESRLRRK